MENQNNTTDLEAKILETNQPIRTEIIEALKCLEQESKGAVREEELKQLKERWESLGVPLAAETSLCDEFNEKCKIIEELISKYKQESQNEKDQIDSILKQLDHFLKDQETLTEQAWNELQKTWESFNLEEQNPKQQQFLKLEHKVQQKIKRLEHDDKCSQLENLCSELEELKKDRNKKLSERQNHVRKIRDQFKTINLHSGPNVVTLREKFNTLCQELTQELSWERWSSSKRKEDLITKANQLLEKGDVKTYRDELQNMQSEWKEIGFTSRDDDKLWDQFKTLCDQIYQKLKSLQDENESKREAIIKELQGLKDSNDWKLATEKIQTLQKNWSDAFPVSRKAARKQGQAYKEVCDHFFNRRRDHQKEIRANQKDNLKDKKLLIEKVVKLQSESNWRHSLPKVKDIQDEWKKTGPVPKKVSDSLWKEFQDACNVIYDKRRAENEVIDKEFEENATKKQALLESLKVLLEENDLSAVKSEMQKIEKQWIEIGKVPRKQQKTIEHEYRVCIKNLNDKEEKAKLAKHEQWISLTKEKAALCHKIESLLFETNIDSAKQQFEDLKTKWEELGISKIEKALKKRYRSCLQFFESGDSQAASPELIQKAKNNLEVCESLVIKLEKLVGIESSNLSASAQRQMMIAELQAKMGRTTQGNKKEEAEDLVSEIQTIGPLETSAYQQLQNRIEAALKQLN